MKTKKIAVEIICFLFILLFTYAAVSKLMIYKGFVIQMSGSYLIADYAHILAWAIPGSELLVVVLLALHKFRRIGMYAATGLMIAFTVYIGAIILMGRDEPCTCGGVLSILGWTEHLIFNIVFLILGLAGILLIRKIDDRGTENVESKHNELIEAM